MRTTLTPEPDVAAKLRELCRRSGRTFKEVVNDTIRKGLNARRELEPDRPFRVRARRLGLRSGLVYDNVAELLEQVEGAEHK